MNKFRKVIAMLLSVCLLASVTLAMAEAADGSQTLPDASATAEVTQAVATTAPAFNDTDVVATVNGIDVTWADVHTYYDTLVNYYGDPDDSSLNLYYAVAMEEAITMKLVTQTAAAQGLDQYTDDEKNTVYEKADADWQSALDNYVKSAGKLTDSSTEDEKAAAYAEAEAYYANLGYDKDKLRQSYLDNDIYTRVQNYVCKDIAVTDEDIQTQYDANVAKDKAAYENDLDAYEYQLMMYNYQQVTEKPWYHPAGYRYVKHILLPVDDTLLKTYTDLQARLEEQMEAENDTSDATVSDANDTTETGGDTNATEAPDATATPEVTADPNASPEPTETPVTQADVDNAKAAILASVQDKTTEINDKIAQGEDFDALIKEYGVKADGTATDPGMTSGSYPNGYEVALASTNFVPEFVQAAFSITDVGGVSAPYVSQYGVHIVKYLGDVPAGPVDLTDEMKENIRTDLLSSKTSAAMDAWQKQATITYTGLIKSYDQLQQEAAATDEDAAAAATDAAATDAAATEAPAVTDAPVVTDAPTATPAA
jgi:parvulin-like peptidyl-prolyl isomerase